MLVPLTTPLVTVAASPSLTPVEIAIVPPFWVIGAVLLTWLMVALLLIRSVPPLFTVMPEVPPSAFAAAASSVPPSIVVAPE